jgi:hypothetical protein
VKNKLVFYILWVYDTGSAQGEILKGLRCRGKELQDELERGIQVEAVQS